MTKKVRHLLDSGVEVVVTPLAPFTIKGLRDRAAELHPLPDPADERYHVELPEGVIGDVRGEETIEWQQDAAEARTRQSEWITFAVIDLACDFGDREALIAQHTDERARLAQYMPLPEDTWQATLQYCLLLSPNEAPDLFRIAAGQMALDEEEVAEGVRYFRPQVQRPKRS